MITQKEITTAVKILRKTQAIPNMPEALFEVYVTKGVMAILECIVRNREGKVLLTWRDDKFYRGWHIPGGFIGVGESIEQALKRITRRELGAAANKAVFAGFFNYGSIDPRSHTLSLTYTCQSQQTPKNGRYFSIAEIKKIPKKDLLYHVPMLLKTAKLWR